MKLFEETTLRNITKEQLLRENGNLTTAFGIFEEDKQLSVVTEQYNLLKDAKLVDIINDSIATFPEQVQDLFSNTDTFYRKIKEKSVFSIGLPTERINGDDSINRYLTIINSFDKSMSVKFGFTNKVLSCQNEFHKVLNFVRFIHNSKLNLNIERFTINLLTVLQKEQEILTLFKTLTNVDTKNVAFDKNEFLLYSLGYDINFAHSNKVNDTALTIKQKDDLMFLESSLDAQVNDKGDTMWGIFNGVTHYTTHVKKGTQDKKDYIVNNALNYVYNVGTLNKIRPNTFVHI